MTEMSFTYRFVLAIGMVSGPLMGGPAGDLRRRIASGEPVKIVVFGDSISAGYQIADPARDAFYSVFKQIVDIAYPQNRVSVISRGFPGATAKEGKQLVQAAVLREKPDVVTIQFGGNDERLGTPLAELKTLLQEMIEDLRASRVKDIALLIQPFQQRHGDSPTVMALRDVGTRLRIPVVDFDRVLRERPHDMRGWYAPFFNHPRGYSSVFMAREMWRVLMFGTGEEEGVTVNTVERTAIVRKGDRLPLAFAVTNHTSTAESVVVELWDERGKHLASETVRVGRRSTRRAGFRLPGPRQGMRSRARQRKLLCTARLGKYVDFAAAWITFSPSPAVRKAGSSASASSTSKSKRMTGTLEEPGQVVMGRGSWKGKQDASARFLCTRTDTKLRITVRVTDDTVITHKETEAFPMFFGDCVQINLDCRSPRGGQGRPFFSPAVPQLFLVPGTSMPRFADWSFGDRPERTVPPPPGWEETTLSSRITENGYECVLELPLTALGFRPGIDHFIGFDVVLDDCDGGRKRDSQLVWSGTADNYLNPSWYGSLRLGDGDHTPSMRLTIH